LAAEFIKYYVPCRVRRHDNSIILRYPQHVGTCERILLARHVDVVLSFVCSIIIISVVCYTYFTNKNKAISARRSH